MRIESRPYGTLSDGTEIKAFTLSNDKGLKIDIMNLGGIILSMLIPDKNGNFEDVTLGFDTLEDYTRNRPFFGAIVGRHANRIEDSRFKINDTEYILNANEGRNQLHGGLCGFDKRVWDYRIISNGETESLELSLFSPDGDENYPGNLEVRVIYTLTAENALEIKYYAVSDADTVLNLTNHAYFNLAGHQSGNILNHELNLNADFFTPVNEECLPTGEILKVQNTPMDFRQARPIGDGLKLIDQDEQLRLGNGYDHNWVLNGQRDMLKEAATLYEPQSGRFMTVLTTKPGIQFYSGNYLKFSRKAKDGVVYDKWQGLCLETQYFPNSTKHPHFPSPILKAGQTYHH
ncbi:MAG: galactose mutarotase, partial [Clostridia bacterium]|nr:galactose mutarotase [Clostridia bacterium]